MLAKPPARPKSLIKWAGGKQQELPNILPAIPTAFRHYFEPFVGGGSVYMAVTAERYFINDLSADLVGLYNALAGGKANQVLQQVKQLQDYRVMATDLAKDGLMNHYKTQVRNQPVQDAVLKGFPMDMQPYLRASLQSKMNRMHRMEVKRGALSPTDLFANLETALKAGIYNYARALLNNEQATPPEQQAAWFYYVHTLAFSGMFRYNSHGGFNVPYGGIAYNKKDIAATLSKRLKLLQPRLQHTTIGNMDFEAFLRQHPPTQHDFVFVDPPYDSEFSTYARNTFNSADQERLSEYLLKHCPAKWLLVVKRTPLMEQLYHGKGLQIRTFSKQYRVSFKNRNNQHVEHMHISNY